MTREEAIEILKKLIEAMQGHVTVLPTPERIAAIRLAIASLETDEAYQLEYENPTTKNDLGVDAVSRQEVLDLIADYDLSMGQVVKGIHALPSVTSQELQSFEWCDTCKEYDQENHCCHRWTKVIRNTVEEMKQEPRWIPVSEYLPVTNDEVLVTYIVNGNAKKRYVETANCFDGEWSSVNDEYRIPNTKIEIIAWCEMPKPYKAESENP